MINIHSVFWQVGDIKGIHYSAWKTCITDPPKTNFWEIHLNVRILCYRLHETISSTSNSILTTPPSFITVHERAILLVKCDFLYSCAAVDKISTDLRARAVSLRQLSYLFVCTLDVTPPQHVITQFFYTPDAIPDTQPTVPKLWRHLLLSSGQRNTTNKQTPLKTSTSLRYTTPVGKNKASKKWKK